MVSVKSFLALLAVQAMTAAAAPAPVSNDPAMALMAQASIYMCDHTRWDGECRNHLINLDSCQNVPGGWNNRISSIRNDSKSFYTCTWYLDDNCRGASYKNQEDADLGDGNGRFNNSISSYSCKRK